MHVIAEQFGDPDVKRGYFEQILSKRAVGTFNTQGAMELWADLWSAFVFDHGYDDLPPGGAAMIPRLLGPLMCEQGPGSRSAAMYPTNGDRLWLLVSGSDKMWGAAGCEGVARGIAQHDYFKLQNHVKVAADKLQARGVKGAAGELMQRVSQKTYEESLPKRPTPQKRPIKTANTNQRGGLGLGRATRNYGW